MLVEIKINVIVDLLKNVFIGAYECLLFEKKTQHLLLTINEKDIRMHLFYKKYFIERQNGSLGPKIIING